MTAKETVQLVEARKDIQYVQRDMKDMKKSIEEMPKKIIDEIMKQMDDKYALKKSFSVRLQIAYITALISLLAGAIALYEKFRS